MRRGSLEIPQKALKLTTDNKLSHEFVASARYDGSRTESVLICHREMLSSLGKKNQRPCDGNINFFAWYTTVLFVAGFICKYMT